MIVKMKMMYYMKIVFNMIFRSLFTILDNDSSEIISDRAKSIANKIGWDAMYKLCKECQNTNGVVTIYLKNYEEPI